MAALTCASPCAATSATSFRDPSPSHSSSASSDSSPSIYVTFKVLQLVHAFRKRVTRKHREQAVSKKVSSAQYFCQDFERQAYHEIDRYLGRNTRRPLKSRPRPTRNTKRPCHPGATRDNGSRRSIGLLLKHLNQSITFGGDSISIIAKSNHLFLERQASLSIAHLDVKELCEVLVTIKELEPVFENDRASCEGDDTYTANLQHLLRRLETELLRLLVSRLVELVHRHVSECQRDQSKRAEEWFFEFPDARHPLSTTWPWNLKPSLAVIWGVCWMFYDRLNYPLDEQGNLVNERGEIELPAAQVVAFLRGQQQQPQSQQQQPQMLSQHPQVQATAMPRQAFGPSHGSLGDPHHSTPPQLLPHHCLTSPSHHRRSPVSHHAARLDQAANAASGLAVPHTSSPNSTAFATQPPSTYAAPAAQAAAAAAGWPEDNFSPALGFTSNDSAYATAAVAGAWNQGLPESYSATSHTHSLPQTRPSQFGFGGQAPLPQRSRHPSAPAISLTTAFPDDFHQQQPQDFHNLSAATSVSTNSSIPLQETTSYPNYHTQYDTGHLSPHTGYNMADTMPPEAREMQTTTPPRSPHDMPIGEPMTRKRSHSQISNGAPFQPADGSHHGSQMGEQMIDEGFSPDRMQVHRPEPLMNSQRKYLCNFAGEECSHLTFDRKCEWSKHMDKHDRPYRCQDPGCAKLQGFTYSGGLLRHEREVHNKHGGPKSQMMCPYDDCKRHTGKGFTRKENLNEHIRRVHENRGQAPQPQPAMMKHDTTFDALAGAARALDDSAETPASRVSEAIMVEDPDLHSPAVKRRRQMPQHNGEQSASEDVEDLRRQIESLQQENAQKDQRLMEMERQLAEMDRKFQEQQRMQNEWYEQQQAAATAAAIASAAQQA